MGGVDAVVNDSTSAATGVFSDIYGHAVATVLRVNRDLDIPSAAAATARSPAPRPRRSTERTTCPCSWLGAASTSTERGTTASVIVTTIQLQEPSFPAIRSGTLPVWISILTAVGNPINYCDPDGRYGKQVANYAPFGTNLMVGFQWQQLRSFYSQ